MDVVLIGYAIFSCLLIIILAFNYILVKYYTDPTESYCLATIISTLSLSVTLLAVLLVPVDILAASGQDDLISHDTIREAFLWLFICMLILSFLLIPFTYFFGEERIEDFDSQRDQLIDRTCESCKSTLWYVLICTILILVGLVVRPQKEQMSEGKEWIRQLFDTDHEGEAAISFTIGCLSIIGILIWSLYSAYGLAALPWLLIKGTKSLEQTRNELEYDLSVIREKYRDIQMRSQRSNTKPTRKEKRELTKLKKAENKILKRSEILENKYRDTSIFITKILKFLTPFRVLIGIAALFLSLILFVALLLGLIDKLINSSCGIQCGFMSTKKSLINPLDELLVASSNFFPLDYLFFGVLVIYVFFASLYGIVKWGIRILCIRIYSIQKKRTMPQALLIASIVIMLLFLGLGMEILILIPGYVTFGSQAFPSEGGIIKCSLDNIDAGHCIMSNISTFFNRISVQLPLFGGMVFMLNWVYVGVFIIWFIITSLQSPKSTLEEDIIEEEEEESLLE